MPKIIIPEKELDKYKKKQGVYSTLNKPIPVNETITKVIEKAFREYCKGHNAPKDMEDLEWTRFYSKLKKYV